MDDLFIPVDGEPFYGDAISIGDLSDDENKDRPNFRKRTTS